MLRHPVANSRQLRQLLRRRHQLLHRLRQAVNQLRRLLVTPVAPDDRPINLQKRCGLPQYSCNLFVVHARNYIPLRPKVAHALACPERSRRACALGVPLLSALCVNSISSPLAICSLLSVIPAAPATNQPSCHPKKNGGSSRPRRLLDPNSLSGAFFYLGRLRSFGSLYYVKFDRITLLQRPVAIPGDCRIVYEYIGPIFPAYESVSFRIIEPLYCSLHFVSPLDGDSGGGKHRRRHEHELRGVYQNGMLSQAHTNNFLTSLCIFILALIGSTAIGPEGYRKKVR